MEVIAVYLLVVTCSVIFYGCFRLGQWLGRYLVGWKLIIVNPKNEGRVWYFDKED